MRKVIIRLEAAIVLMSLLGLSVGCNKNDQLENVARSPGSTSATSSPASEPAQMAKFSDNELDELLAPIALYPDPLIAQMLPAATFVDEIIEANRMLNGNSDDDLIAKQNWDVSVKSIAHYPPVLKKMADDPDWTASLGQAYVDQASDINKAIQWLRYEASDAGHLATTKQQDVIEKDNIIRIEPAQPEVIYVPEYNAETVYVEEQDSGPSTGEVIATTAIAFGAGMMIGAWLNRDYDYYGYYGPPGPYYHGWHGTGWIATNQRYANVNVNRNVYINDSYSNINVNRGVYNRNVAQYRTGVTQRAVVRDQRVQNARVNRHRGMNNGGVDRDRVNQLDRDRDIDGARDRTGDRAGDRAGDRMGDPGDRGGNRGDRVGDRSAGRDDRSPQGRDRNDVRRQDNGPSRREAPSSRPAPRQQQRSAPSRGGGAGGRRR